MSLKTASYLDIISLREFFKRVLTTGFSGCIIEPEKEVSNMTYEQTMDRIKAKRGAL